MLESVFSSLLASDVITTYLAIAVFLYTLCYVIEEVLGKYLFNKKWRWSLLKNMRHHYASTLIDYFMFMERTAAAASTIKWAEQEREKFLS